MLFLSGVQVSFFYYPNEVVKDFIKVEEMPNLRIASILDIAVMKVIAIGGRGAKKDFFDLYCIVKQTGISVLELANALIKKCGENVNYANIIMGLSYFEDAEQELLPKTFMQYDWNAIKQFFINFQPQLETCLEKLRFIIV